MDRETVSVSFLRRSVWAGFATTLCFLWGGIARGSEHGAVGPWELVRNDAGVEVYRRIVGNSPLHEFQGTGVIESPITAVLAVLDDAEHRLEWMDQAVAQQLISRSGDRDQTFYTRTGAPWPVSDRDSVVRAVTTVDAKAKVVKVDMHSVDHPEWPAKKGVVRMPHLCGHWYLWPTNGGKWTRVEYQVHADPGGSLPTYIINQVSKKIPHNTITGIQRQVQRRKYPEYEQKLMKMPEYQLFLPVSAQNAAQPGPPASFGVAGSSSLAGKPAGAVQVGGGGT